MKLEEMTIEQLKAYAYDCLARTESAQRDLQIVNARIAELLKQKELPVEPVEVKPIKK